MLVLSGPRTFLLTFLGGAALGLGTAACLNHTLLVAPLAALGGYAAGRFRRTPTTDY